MYANINRPQIKANMKALLAEAQVSPKAMVALHLGITMVLSLLITLAELFPLPALFRLFLIILSWLITTVLGAGFILYCMAVRRGERAEFSVLFDGFSFVGKIISLQLLISLFVFLWMLLFIVPGIVAALRYRFAIYNLCENPSLSIFQALDMSKQQTLGYKWQLYVLDWSYCGWLILTNLFSASTLLESLPAYGDLSTGVILAITVLGGLWTIFISMFYLPVYQCTELGYFEVAKQTSGIRADGGPYDAPNDEDDAPTSGSSFSGPEF